MTARSSGRLDASDGSTPKTRTKVPKKVRARAREPESNEPESPSGSWCSHLVWHDVDGDESAGVRSGVVFHRARNGAAERVAHGDVSEARVAFDEATGISSFILQMVDGRRVECRVTSAVAARGGRASRRARGRERE